MGYMTFISGLLVYMWPEWMRERVRLFPWRQVLDQDCYVVPGLSILRIDW
jgi:hypothetical protein